MAHNFLRSVYSLSRPLLLMGSGLVFMGCSQAETTTRTLDDVPSQMSDTSEMAAKPEIKSPEIRNFDMQEVDVDVAPTLPSQIRSADSHVHGGATLSIVSEDDSIVIELETPLYNLLGFEYAPQTEDEKAEVREVETRLRQPQILMRFNDEAECVFDEVNNSVVLFEIRTTEREHKTDKHNNGHSHNHGDKNDAEHHHSKEHSHSVAQINQYDHDHSKAHKDIIFNYSLTCEYSSKLNTLHVELFKNFPNFAKLDLVYLGPSKQMSMELSPSKSKADLTR